mmetsp:Transcript_50357/g.58782  ORF Transcript_50357/g.58782 Transcript_50357/m.58782 type:complete len:348 (+) Transcript_50357:97-1140(+)
MMTMQVNMTKPKIRNPKFNTARRSYFIWGTIALVLGVSVVAFVIVPHWKDDLPMSTERGGSEITDISKLDEPGQMSVSGSNVSIENKEYTSNVQYKNDESQSSTNGELSTDKRIEIMSTVSHDVTSFTQGLTFANGVLYESTGLYSQSKVRRLDITTGEVLSSINIPNQYFGEGLAYYPKNNTLIQLTWKRRTVLLYDADSLQQVNEIQFQTGRNEGWGITYYPIMDVFIVSDGSNNLYFWDVVLMQEISRVSVTWQDGSPRDYLNELEYDPVTGLILSNVWYEDYIVAIDPTSGVIKTKFDLAFIWPKKDRPKTADCLNGISVTDKPGVFLITGKKWPKMYFVKLG